jgi:hypothetical protein
MTQPGGTYPREIVTTERPTEDSEENQVATVVANEHEEKAVRAAIAYMDAFNAGDVEKESACLNHPHARVGADGTLAIREGDSAQRRQDFFDVFRQRTGWNHSCWDLREVIQSSENKVHIQVQFSRYRTDGSKIGAYPSIWVMTSQDGHWGIKMRSSFAA